MIKDGTQFYKLVITIFFILKTYRCIPNKRIFVMRGKKLYTYVTLCIVCVRYLSCNIIITCDKTIIITHI